MNFKEYPKICPVIDIIRGVSKIKTIEALVDDQYVDIASNLPDCVQDAFASGSNGVIVVWYDGAQERRSVYKRDEKDLVEANINSNTTTRMIPYSLSE
mgnify:CR=1 FL=1